MKLKSLMASLLLATSLGASAAELPLASTYLAEDILVGISYSAEDLLKISTRLLSSDLKEQVEAIRADALDFLAGGEATETLLMTIEEVREKETKLANLSDEQVAAIIIEVTK